MFELPHLASTTYLTDGGLETDLIFNHGIDLPEFAAFPLLRTIDGREQLRRYYTEYLEIAQRDDRGLVLETPTWRASADWGTTLGYSAADLEDINADAVELVREISAGYEPLIVSGNVGPRGDGYSAEQTMTVNEAAAYHLPQITALARAGADMIGALTLTYVAEATGLAIAAAEAGIPIAIAFTVETDGRLPSGIDLAEAIDTVDHATDSGPAYYMINCAHPTHFAAVLRAQGPWERVQAVRANASAASHAELDEATELDDGNPAELAQQYLALGEVLPKLAVVGGCCGTDARHIEAMSRALSGAVLAS